MNKKNINYCLLLCCCINLVSCGVINDDSISKNELNINKVSQTKNNSSLGWLVGRWYSNEWNVTYDFSELGKEWTIKNHEQIIDKNARIGKNSTDKDIIIISKDGTKFFISKLNKKEMIFQQVAKEGLIGITNSVKFTKD
ncbi:hypothetical protein ACIL4E_002572 [Enterococcus hirae]